MIALFGGTFDPLHLGHLRVAWEAAEALDCPVHLLPAHIPPHRQAPVASAGQRLAIIEAALAGQTRLRVDARELQRNRPSWTVDTLRELRDEAGAHEPMVLLLGADALAGLPGWHQWPALLELAHLAVLSRPGHGLGIPAPVLEHYPDCECSNADALRRTPAGRVFRIEVTALDVSASQVRALLAAGREPRYLVPDAVLRDPALLAPYRQPG